MFYLPFWRGMADMMIGIIIYQLPKPKEIPGVIIELCSGIVLVILLRINGDFDYLAVAFIILLTWSICSNSSVLRKIGKLKIVNVINKYQYGMYVNHICVILIFRQLAVVSSINLGVAIIILFGCIFLFSGVGYVYDKPDSKAN